MNRRLHRSGVVLLMASLMPLLAAAPAVDDAAILPYIDEGTFLVARLDVERVDQEAMGKAMEEMFDKTITTLRIPPDQQGLVKGQMMQSVTTSKSWLTDMAAAGAKHVYLLLDTADLRAGDDDPVIVIPLTGDTNADRVRELLSGGGNAEAQEIGKAIVVAQSESAAPRLKNRIASGVPVERADLATAFAAAGGADVPLRIALIPSDSAREWIEEALPQIPEQVVAGGADTKILSRGVRYVSIGVTQKPGMLANFTIRCQDAEKAKALSEVLNKGSESLKKHLPAADAEKQVAALTPKLAGDTITLSLNPLDLAGIRFESEIEVDDAKAAPAQPAKKDDGGL